MPVTHVSTPSAHLEVTLDGVTLTRTKAKALQRGVGPRLDVPWDQVLGAETSRTAQGRTVVRLLVAGAPVGLSHREDPWAVKVPRGLGDAARDLAAQIEHEVATRRRWREESAREQAAREQAARDEPGHDEVDGAGREDQPNLPLT